MPLDISFERSVTVEIKVEVTISTGVGWSSDYEALIQDSIAAVINAGAIGDTVLLTKLYAPAYLGGSAAGQTYDVSLLEIGKNSDPVSGANIALDWDENPVCVAASDVTVIIT